MLSSLLIALLSSPVAFASSASPTDQCPKLKGQFFCEGITEPDVHLILTIGEARCSDQVIYRYGYEYVGVPEEPFERDFFASNAGTLNPDHDGKPETPRLIGRCIDDKFFLSESGELEDNSYFNFVDDRGHYLVTSAKTGEVVLDCAARKEKKSSRYRQPRCDGTEQIDPQSALPRGIPLPF